MKSFQEIITTHQDGKIHAMLGNGFSRACRDDIFSYDALFDRADFSTLSAHCKGAFEALETTDFESVIKALQSTSALLALYKPEDKELADTLLLDAEKLREVLVSAIAGSHPDWPGEISQDAYAACKAFLSNFERVYTLNYDLLLYWAYMQDEVEPALECDDGFRKPYSGMEDYVSWEVANSYNQKIYYIHGALHLFDSGDELQKYTWINTGMRLTEQVRDALSNEKYPLFVSEGSSEEKLEKIKHSGYLHRGLASLGSIGGVLIVYGLSFSSNDEHVLQLIELGKVKTLAVGIYGDPDSAENQKIMTRANLMRDRRAQKRRATPLEIEFFDAETANVWG